MNDTKEDNVQNHRQQLLNHQQELDRDIEAGSYDGDDETHDEGVEGEEGEEGEGGEGESVLKQEPQEIPPLYNVEPGCTPLGCYSAIITFIIMVLGIVSLLMYSAPPDATADNLVFSDNNGSTILIPTEGSPELDEAITQ